VIEEAEGDDRSRDKVFIGAIKDRKSGSAILRCGRACMPARADAAPRNAFPGLIRLCAIPIAEIICRQIAWMLAG
jgi:hypothetical protein